MTFESAYQRYVFIRDRALPPILATLIGIFLVLLLDRREPLKVESLTITPTIVKAGSSAYVIFGATENRDCEGIVHRSIIDSGGHVFTLAPEPSIYPSLLSGDKKQFVKEVTIPLGVAPGPATYVSDLDRWCNWPQKLFWHFHNHYEAAFTVARVPGPIPNSRTK